MDAVLDGGVGDSCDSMIVTCHATQTGGRQDVPVFAMVELGGYYVAAYLEVARMLFDHATA